MNRLIQIAFLMAIIFSSCVSKKKYTELLQNQSDLESQLVAERAKLVTCHDNVNDSKSEVSALKASNGELRDRVGELYSTNSALLNNLGNLATLSTKEAENLEKSLESIREKDIQITQMRDAITRRDSVTLALVTSLKSALGGIDDKDIEVNVEKGVVFISISDKLLFNSGSYKVSERAQTILGKVATVMKSKPEIDFMVEGHTDNVPIKQPGIKDNWDLSVLRATAVVRVLQEKFDLAPERMTAAGRSYYVPLADNDSADKRARNRRTRIVVLPKLDQFYNMIEEGMEAATNGDVE